MEEWALEVKAPVEWAPVEWARVEWARVEWVLVARALVARGLVARAQEVRAPAPEVRALFLYFLMEVEFCLFVFYHKKVSLLEPNILHDKNIRDPGK